MLRTNLSRRVIVFVLLPLAMLFAASSLWIEESIRANTTRQIRSDLFKQQKRRQAEQLAQSRQIQRALQVLGDNAGLKAALTLQRDLLNSGALRDEATNRQLTHTLEERLQAVRETINVDSISLVDAQDQPLVHWQSSTDTIYLQRAIPINAGDENLGHLLVGHEFNLSSIAGGAEAVLIHKGKIESSTLKATKLTGPAQDWAQSGEVELNGERFVAVPLSLPELGPDRSVVMLASIDAAVAPFLTTLRTVLFPTGAISLLLAMVLIWFSSRAVTKPLQSLTLACQQSIQRGILEIPPTPPTGVLEVNILADSLYRAAVAATSARLSLEQAYLQILEALVESLEARDPYTAGHSRRVSRYSILIARQLGLCDSEIEALRIGALLHDIGKIGIPDAVLLKDGRLSDEEFRIIQQHPDIGVRILERIGAFGTYLASVGLHHENHDGSGYPNGLCGDQIPVEARIVHVADAYDAMTSNRPYRNRMPEEKVRRILQECSGTQFDPNVVAAFFSSPINSSATDSTATNLESLNDAIKNHQYRPRADFADSVSIVSTGVTDRL